MARADKLIVKCFLLCVFGVVVGRRWIPRHPKLAARQFGGSGVKISKRALKESPEIELMKEDWRSVFEALDVDQDEMITEKDIDILKKNFIRVYESRGIESVKVSNLLDNFMHCVVFGGLQSPEGVSEAKFLRIYSKAYQLYRPERIKRFHRCNEYLLSVIDRNKDGFLSFKELLDDFTAWNKGNIEFVQYIFQLMGPNEENLVPVENFDNFYTKLAMGKGKQ